MKEPVLVVVLAAGSLGWRWSGLRPFVPHSWCDSDAERGVDVDDRACRIAVLVVCSSLDVRLPNGRVVEKR